MNSKLGGAVAVVLLGFSSVATADEPPKPKEKQKTDEPLVEKVERAAAEADRSAEKLNEGVVGKKKQNENERRAREKRATKAEDERDAKEAGEKVGRATTTAATALVDSAQDVTRGADKPGQYNPFALTWNPLGLIVGGRLSLNLEYAPVTHHVIIVSPHFASPSQDVVVGTDTKVTNRFTGVGGEIGYRYYTGKRGMNGVFLGPSLITGVYNASLPGSDTVFANVGIAADVGFQHLIWDRLALGAGVGIQYLHVSDDFGDLAAGPSTIASSGVKPRLLAQIGYAF